MLLSIFTLSLIGFCSSTIVLPPVDPSRVGIDAGAIFIQGAEINAKNYVLFCKQLQQKFNYKLWVAVAEFPLSIPEPLLIDKLIEEAYTSLEKAGLKINSNTPFFFIGHSLGGIMIQDNIFKSIYNKSFPVKVAGLILEGSYVERKHYDKMSNPLTPPILALGGTLDGVNRISRMAESRYFDMQNTDNLLLFKKLTLLVPGMNHYQFSGEGQPPHNVRTHDLKPDIDDQSARDQITSIVCAFMSVSLKSGSDQDKSLLRKYYDLTTRLVDPIIDALQMEGSYHLIPPCYSVEDKSNCTLGSPWTSHYSQNIMGNDSTMINTDVFHPVYQINPVHLPVIFNSCANQTSSCVLNVTTVSQLEYPKEDFLDISLEPVAASEIKTKLASRQAIIHAQTGVVVDLKISDAGNLCATINNASINWAMSITPKDVLERYLTQGIVLTLGNDIGPLNVGPLWIWSPLEYNRKLSPDSQRPIVELRSPMMKTPIDYPVQLAAGFHYCKVLSPARAIEWIYTDSLRL